MAEAEIVPSLSVDWEQRYRDGTTRWERGGLNPAYLAWRASGLLSPCRILIPGAGRSPEPEAMARDMFSVTVVDAAQSAIDFQRPRLEVLGGEVLQGDLLAWQPERPFDAIYDQTCLCALPPAIWTQYAARQAEWVLPGGALFALFMQTGQEGGPPFHCDMALMRRLYRERIWSWPEVLDAPAPHGLGFAEQPVLLRRLA
jgi:methyl halide transferase